MNKKDENLELFLMKENRTSLIQKAIDDNNQNESRKVRVDNMCKHLEKMLPKSEVAKFRKTVDSLSDKEFEELWDKSQRITNSLIGEEQNNEIKK